MGSRDDDDSIPLPDWVDEDYLSSSEPNDDDLEYWEGSRDSPPYHEGDGD